MENDSQNIPRELIPSRGTVLLAAHGNTDDPTFFWHVWGYQNIYEKNESCVFQPNSNKILKTKNMHTKYMKSVSVIIDMFERLNEVKVFLVILELCRQSGICIKNSINFWYFTKDLRRTLAIFETKVKLKLGAWTLHYFSTHNSPSFVKRWWYFTDVANDIKRTPFHIWVRDKRSRSNFNI